MTLESHDAANIFPLDDEHIDELAADIKEHGLEVPIEMFEGKILDGRRRYRACLMAGIMPTTRDVEVSDPVAYVLSLNLHRRHLTESQRAMIGAKAKAVSAKRAKERMSEGGKAAGRGRPKQGPDNCPDPNKGDARDDAGKAVGVSGKSIDRAATVLESGNPDLIEAVEQNKIAVSRAAAIAELPKAEQQEQIAAAKSRGKCKKSSKVSERALACREAIEGGMVRDKAVAKFGFANPPAYKRALQVTNSDNPALVKAMDDGIVSVRVARDLLIKGSDEAIVAGIEAARFDAEQKKHGTAKAKKDATGLERIRDLLGRTWVDWRGFSKAIRIKASLSSVNGKTQQEITVLVANVRQAVNAVLDLIEKEVSDVSEKR